LPYFESSSTSGVLADRCASVSTPIFQATQFLNEAAPERLREFRWISIWACVWKFESGMQFWPSDHSLCPHGQSAKTAAPFFWRDRAGEQGRSLAECTLFVGGKLLGAGDLGKFFDHPID
jgi:hypothetical protein